MATTTVKKGDPMDEARPLESTAPAATETPAGGSDEKDVKLHVAPEAGNVEFILDIPLRVSVELGRTKILVQDLLKLHKGSVLELSKLAGEALEVLVNDRVVARGEVIVINEKFGIRLIDIVSHAQRIRELGA